MGGRETSDKAQAALSLIYGPAYCSQRFEAGPLMLLSGDEENRGNFSDGYFLREVCLEEGLPRICIETILVGAWEISLV